MLMRGESIGAIAMMNEEKKVINPPSFTLEAFKGMVTKVRGGGRYPPTPSLVAIMPRIWSALDKLL